MDNAELKQQDIKLYDINWTKVKTIKDIKLIIQVIATRLQIDHNDAEDLEVYSKLEHLLISVDGENIG